MNFCLGFILNTDLTEVLLIRKNRGPECIKGKLNGIGGKIKDREPIPQAMIRECKEETNLDLYEEWKYFCELNYKHQDTIYCYYAITDKIYDYQQMEDESIEIFRIDNDYQLYDYVADLDWMIPMILNHYNKLDKTELFCIQKIS